LKYLLNIHEMFIKKRRGRFLTKWRATTVIWKFFLSLQQNSYGCVEVYFILETLLLPGGIFVPSCDN